MIIPELSVPVLEICREVFDLVRNVLARNGLYKARILQIKNYMMLIIRRFVVSCLG